MKNSRKTMPVEYEPSIVTFIDVLGFRALVENKSAAEVHKVLATFQHFTRPDDEGLSAADLKLISHARARAVSDAIVRVRPYKTLYQDGALFHEILDLLHAQIELMNLGVLVRAGLTVGNAYVGKKQTDPVFGPAMVRAYEIESKEAIFPRIVVDDLALKLHRNDKHLRSDNNSLAEEIKVLSRLLAKDDDGLRFIDYLGALDEFDPGDYFTFLQRHAELIREGRKLSGASVQNKFDWLATYHNGHITALRKRIVGNAKQTKLFVEEFEYEPTDFFKEVWLSPS
jgi:hypothetical protein